jgi:hypothetical protein
LGRPGDTFEAFGAQFGLRALQRLPLAEVRDRLYLEEGCATPDEFQEAWSGLHPRKRFHPTQMAYVHWFVRQQVTG